MKGDFLLYELIRTPSPSGYEKAIQNIVMRELKAYNKFGRLDGKGNIWCTIGKEPNTLFTAHMDSVHRNMGVPVDFEIDKNNIMSLTKDCKQTALGADDKVGVRVLLHMIEKGIKGVYIFTVSEEIGCIGAAHAAKSCPKHVKHAVCFDRKANDSVITRMAGGTCCHDDFADSIIKQFGEQGMEFRKDTFGSFTDTNKFREQTLNHTNISAGYKFEHSKLEVLDLNHVDKLMKAVLKIKWEDLPTIKRPVTTYNRYQHGNQYSQEGAFAKQKKKIEDMVATCFSTEEAFTKLTEFIEKERYISTTEAKTMIKELRELHEFEMACYDQCFQSASKKKKPKKPDVIAKRKKAVKPKITPKSVN